MTLRKTLVASALLLVLGATGALAQQQTGEIYGRAADNSGAVLPGATVTVAGPALIQPRVAITSETGTYRIPELPIGTYSVTFELAGFRSLSMQDIRITIGFRAQINAALELSTVQETVTVTGASPLVDTREVGTSSTFDLETMQNIPSARDPWVMLERAPGIFMDRANVGGNQSGQQSGYISRGSSTGNNKWSVDGVDITDMAATGASPIYYDFDMLEEMQVTTGGADVSQQTGGVGINLVTKSGTDRFKGNARFLVTDDSMQGDNITPELKAQGAGSGAPIQNIRDYGFDVGGPIVKSKLWYWGSYGTQDIKTGVVGFYKNTPECRPNGQPLNSRTAETELLRSCLETDLTTLNNYNWKITWVPFSNNRFNFQNTWAEKVRNARDASDLRPIETTYRQKAVDSAFGTFGWLTGPSPFWKAADQHVVNDRMLVDVMWAHLGNNFVLDFHEDDLSRRAAGVRDDDRRVCAFVSSVDLPASDQQPRRGEHILRAGNGGRRPLAQVRLPLAQCALHEPQPPRRLRLCALHQRRPELRRDLARRQLRIAPRYACLLRAGHVHAQPVYAERRSALRPPGRRGAGRPRAREPVLPDADARDRFPGRGRRGGVERPLAAHRRHLRPERRRQDGVLVVVRDLLRADGAWPALEPARRHRRGVRALSVGRHQWRQVRAAERGQHLGAVPCEGCRV